MDWSEQQAKYGALVQPRQQQATTKTPTKKQGRGGFLTSLISEVGGAGGAAGGAATGAAIGSVVPGFGTVLGGLVGAGLGGFLGGTSGRVVENEVRDGRVGIGDALKEGAISGVAGAGPLRFGKAAYGLTKAAATGSNLAEGATEAVSKSILGKLTRSPGTTVGKRLTEAGSGLKADPNVGGIERLNQQADFMSKYTGTPRQQRVKMEGDMKNLSQQVDDVLTKTPVQLDGSKVGQRLKAAAEDLTDERYLDLDLNNPSVTKIIDRYSEKFASAQDAKGINDIVKTLNKTATRAQNKLVDEKAGALTVQEQAALALKRAGDDVLSEVPEIAPLKKGMAQIFEVTPQVAKQAERGVGVPLVSGVKVKAPFQIGSSAASRLGARLQGTDPGATSKGILSKVLGANLLDTQLPEAQQVEQPTDPSSDAIGGVEMSALGPIQQPEVNTDPFAPENAQASVQKILAQGGDMKDVQAYLANVAALQQLTAGAAGSKPLSAEASKVLANANSGLKSLDQLEGMISTNGGVPKGTLVPGRSLFGGLIGGATGTNNYDTVARNISDVITRLRTGAALTDQEASFYNSQLPQAFDDPETVQNKLNIFRDLFSSVANRTGTSGSDLESAAGL